MLGMCIESAASGGQLQGLWRIAHALVCIITCCKARLHTCSYTSMATPASLERKGVRGSGGGWVGLGLAGVGCKHKRLPTCPAFPSQTQPDTQRGHPPALLQRLQQRVGADQATTAHVDQHGGGLQAGRGIGRAEQEQQQSGTSTRNNNQRNGAAIASEAANPLPLVLLCPHLHEGQPAPEDAAGRRGMSAKMHTTPTTERFTESRMHTVRQHLAAQHR